MSFWLRCRVDEGMFSNEAAVTYPPTKLPCQKSVFISRAYVRETGENEGMVQVKVASERDAMFALLPTEYGDIVRIEDGDLLEA